MRNTIRQNILSRRKKGKGRYRDRREESEIKKERKIKTPTKDASGAKLYEACCRLRNKIKRNTTISQHYIEPVTMGPYFHKERKCVFSRKKKKNLNKK